MHTVDLLEATLDAARSFGYEVRLEWLGGSGGGDCEVNGRKLLYVDLALGPAEQLEQVTACLTRISAHSSMPIRPELRPLLAPRRKSA